MENTFIRLTWLLGMCFLVATACSSAAGGGGEKEPKIDDGGQQFDGAADAFGDGIAGDSGDDYLASEEMDGGEPAGSEEDNGQEGDDSSCACPDGFNCVGGQCQRRFEVLVVGEGLGGTAAALASARAGAHTALVAFQPWLGGQATSQGVSALDESIPWDCHPHFSESYSTFRELIRRHYLENYLVVAAQNDSDWSQALVFDPGSCWVSRLCFEPQVGAAVLERMLSPYAGSGALLVLRELELVDVIVEGNKVKGVRFSTPVADGRKEVAIYADVTVDATELGDLIPLSKIPYRTGAEYRQDTAETHAREVAEPECVQPFTFTFILERRPQGEDHTIAVPPGYDPSRYSLVAGRRYYVFDDPEGKLTFWTYRRLIAASNFDEPQRFPHDLAMINWGPDGNDYNTMCLGSDPAGCNIIDKSPQERQAILELARAYTLGFVYWLQHDVPRDDGKGYGYPNLKLRTDIFPTVDGLSPYPYIRESRRIRAMFTVTEEHIKKVPGRSRAVLFEDSVGTNLYSMDLHRCAAGEDVYQDPTWSGAMLPAQIPLRALIPEAVDGFLAGAKNIGTTHLSNGGYRLHPSEWHVGEAAGVTAALAVRRGVEVRQIATDKNLLRALQHELVEKYRLPLFWWSDLSARDGVLFRAANMVGVAGVMVGYPDNLLFDPAATVRRGQAAAIVGRLFDLEPVTECRPSFSDVPCDHPYYAYVQALANAGITSGCGGGLFCVDQDITRAQLAAFMVRAAGWPLITPSSPSYRDVPSSHPSFSVVETARANGLFQEETSGDTFRPDEACARASTAVFSYNVLRKRYNF